MYPNAVIIRNPGVAPPRLMNSSDRKYSYTYSNKYNPQSTNYLTLIYERKTEVSNSTGRTVKSKFEQRWQRAPNDDFLAKAVVKRIFEVRYPHNSQFRNLMKIVGLLNDKEDFGDLRFHGTGKACNLGAEKFKDRVADPEKEFCRGFANGKCPLCTILSQGFMPSSKGRLGPGIYSSRNPVKAAKYSKNAQGQRSHFVIGVMVDRGNYRHIKKYKEMPDTGDWDCLEAVTGPNSQYQYPETLILDEWRVVPRFLIVYE